MKTGLILALMLKLIPAHYQTVVSDETEKEAVNRYGMIAEAINGVSKGDAVLARYLLTVFRHESSFNRSVHTGDVRGDAGRSWCLGQIMIGTNPRSTSRFTAYPAKKLVGADLASTTRCARTAAAYLRWARRRCKNDNPSCVFRAYGSVRSAKDKRIVARVSTYNRISRLAEKH